MKSRYAQAGVDIDTGNAIVRDIKRVVRATFSRRVMADIGLFGGLFDARALGQRPVLVSSIDGVGTKLHVAAALRRFHGVGRDIVAHCCNDIVVQGARPLFFLDYVAAASLDQGAIVEMVAGMAAECGANGCALIGGETAEMPGTYLPGQIDLAGCIIGVVNRADLIDGSRIRCGDVVLGLESSGLHTNGFSLARKVLLKDAKLDLRRVAPGCDKPLADLLLEPHRSYTPLVLGLMKKTTINGLAHITGGGLVENIPRILPQGTAVRIDARAWQVPPVFTLIGKLGKVSPLEMFRVFNMGIGMVAIVRPGAAKAVLAHARRHGIGATAIGAVTPGRRTVRLDF